MESPDGGNWVSKFPKHSIAKGSTCTLKVLAYSTTILT